MTEPDRGASAGEDQRGAKAAEDKERRGWAPREVSFRFVRMGATAPEAVPASEIWLDVGNRVGPGVVDHHGGDTQAWSASELVAEKCGDLVLKHVRDERRVTLVLHTSPDMDAVCAAWLAKSVLRTGKLPEPQGALDDIVRAVSENDQGFVRTPEPERCWPVVFRTLLSTEYASLGDEARTRAGIEVLGRTLAELASGRDLSSAAEAVMTPAARAEIMQARRDYLEDLSRGIVFRVRLPVRPRAGRALAAAGPPQDPPPPSEARWSLADAIFLDEPRSSLFKEMARSDAEHSPMRQGFVLMVVSQDAGRTRGGARLFRHVLSTDPFSGLHLRGLGKRLEELEERAEDAAGEELLPGRRRVGPGEGRHGYPVESPWYDGRGHGFTIVDSPSVTLEGKETCASRLASDDVLDAVWEYGDPARFMNVFEAEFTLVHPVDLLPGWEKEWPEETGLSAVCPGLCEEVRQSLGAPRTGAAVSIRTRPGDATPGRPGSGLPGQQIWVFPGGTSLWLGSLSFGAGVGNARDLCREIASRREDLCRDLAPRGIRLSHRDEAIHLVHCRLGPADASLEDRSGPSGHVVHRLAAAMATDFRSRVEADELAGAETVLSRDKRFVLHATERGMAVVSTRPVLFGKEKDFHRPERSRALAALALGHRVALTSVTAAFARHRAERGLIKAGALVLEDRWRLMEVEQLLSFARVAEHRFGEKSYDAMVKVLGVREQLGDAKEKINSLAERIRDARSAFYQRLAFWISFLFAPLALTAAFFSGIHMERGFAEKYHTFLPAGWEPAGVLLFLAFFLILCSIAGLLWVLVVLGHRKSDVLRWLRRRRPGEGARGGERD